MRSIQLVAPRTLEERPLPDPPDPGPGEALVKLHACGICGSDLHWFFEGHIGSNQAKYPQILGHEPAGEIAAVGPGVTEHRVGDRVSIEPSITCGHCEFCLAGRSNNCVHSVFMGGPSLHGLFREYAVIPAHNADPVPDNLTWAEATLIEPVAVAVHMMELVEIHPGDTVAITGAGPIGMLCAAMVRLAGASRVWTCDPVPHRLKLAMDMGAHEAVAPARLRELVMDETRGRGADIVFDAAGMESSVNLALALARTAGAVVLIGLPGQLKLAIDIYEIMNKELRVLALKRSNHKGAEAAKLLGQGLIPRRLITHCLPLEATPRAFSLLEHYDDGAGKVVIEVA